MGDGLEVMKSASTALSSAPKLPGVSSPGVNFLGTLEVGTSIARSLASTALAPVKLS